MSCRGSPLLVLVLNLDSLEIERMVHRKVVLVAIEMVVLVGEERMVQSILVLLPEQKVLVVEGIEVVWGTGKLVDLVLTKIKVVLVDREMKKGWVKEKVVSV